MQELRIGPGEADQRLDRFLRRLLGDMPLSAIFRHLRAGHIRVDGNKAKPGLRLCDGMVLALHLGSADLARVAAGTRTAERPPAGGNEPGTPAPGRSAAWRGPEPRIVHRDADVMVVDKPAGMAVQAGSKHDDDHLVAWLHRQPGASVTATFAPSPAHRIDRGTSGLCAIGLSPAGLRGLAAAFREATVRKVYLAIVHGVPVPASGTIDAPLRTLEDARAAEPKVTVDARGKPARTDYEVVRSAGDRSLLRLLLHSGRTHQIRAHLAHIGHPIVGDHRYGSPVQLGRTLLLHAAELELRHPVTGTPLRCAATPPQAFAL